MTTLKELKDTLKSLGGQYGQGISFERRAPITITNKGVIFVSGA